METIKNIQNVPVIREQFKSLKSASQLKEEGKAKGLEKKALREYVNNGLKGIAQSHNQAVEAMVNSGFQFRIDRTTKTGLVKITAGQSAVQAPKPKGPTKAELLETVARLEAMLVSK